MGGFYSLDTYHTGTNSPHEFGDSVVKKNKEQTTLQLDASYVICRRTRSIIQTKADCAACSIMSLDPDKVSQPAPPRKRKHFADLLVPMFKVRCPIELLRVFGVDQC